MNTFKVARYISVDAKRLILPEESLVFEMFFSRKAGAIRLRSSLHLKYALVRVLRPRITSNVHVEQGYAIPEKAELLRYQTQSLKNEMSCNHTSATTRSIQQVSFLSCFSNIFNNNSTIGLQYNF